MMQGRQHGIGVMACRPDQKLSFLQAMKLPDPALAKIRVRDESSMLLNPLIPIFD